jgi:DNA-binding CsgD family transcriptional regulator
MATPGTREPALSGGDATAPGRAIEVLEQARALLGPGTVPELLGDEADLEAGIDNALTQVREYALSYEGPDALAVVRVAYELTHIAWEQHKRVMDRRVAGLSSVQRALAELRTVGSVELMIGRCTQVVCERCGFDRAILFRLQDEGVMPASAFDRKDPNWSEKVSRTFAKHENPVLAAFPIESEMARRRMPTIVRDVQNDPRTFKPLIEQSEIRAYVAAPIMPEGRVIGFLHADVRYHGRDVDIIDRDILWAFAEGCGYALERTLLHDQVRTQREKIRGLLRSADELVSEIGEAELKIERADSEAAVRPASALAAGGTRIHSLLTRREIEVMELLVNGETNKRIAARLVLTEGTVKSHVTNIFRKLRAANRAEAVSRYMRLLALDHR